ncbi:MAG TPA: N-acyl homoserine lactonase family protein [Burkholderiales bacterium]|nr:N-acyl homoserine lactonase family protein [Burkholderiales bacterium]
MSALEPYEIYAIRYAHHDRRASENFIGGDPHDAPMPLDYFVWAIRSQKQTFVLDTGFDAEMAKRRKREFLRSPGEGLKAIGIDPAKVEDVVISHMHYDHVGNHTLFPNARYHLQDREIAYCTGRYMCHPTMRYPYEPEDVAAVVRRLFDGRVQFHDGEDELAPGLTLHHVGGHTMGLQVLRVWTARGWVVLASDASHFYANMNQGRPFPIVYNVGEMLEGHRTMRRLASSANHVIPGHDPLVLKRYPPARPELEGVVVRLDVEPRAQ